MQRCSQAAAVLQGSPVSFSWNACPALSQFISCHEMNSGNQFATGSFAFASCGASTGHVSHIRGWMNAGPHTVQPTLFGQAHLQYMPGIGKRRRRKAHVDVDGAAVLWIQAPKGRGDGAAPVTACMHAVSN